MKKVICAITVSMNYIDRKKYSIKYLSIGKRKSGGAFWYVRHVGKTGVDRVILEADAIDESYKYNVPYIDEIRHGETVSHKDMKILKQHGVAVK